jgi:hypothetical protein
MLKEIEETEARVVMLLIAGASGGWWRTRVEALLC